MIHTILKAKHWQLFILIFGLPFLAYLFIVYQIFQNINQLENGDPDAFQLFEPVKYLLVLGILSMIIYWTWYWSVGVGLQSKIPAPLKTSGTAFKVFLFFPAIYITAISLFVLGVMQQLLIAPETGELPINPAVIPIILPFHFFSIFCVFYCIYFVAKTIKTAELQRKVKFSDFVAEFFLVWFFPIGVWILQPTINKLADHHHGDSPIDDFDDIL